MKLADQGDYFELIQTLNNNSKTNPKANIQNDFKRLDNLFDFKEGHMEKLVFELSDEIKKYRKMKINSHLDAIKFSIPTLINKNASELTEREVKLILFGFELKNL